MLFFRVQGIGYLKMQIPISFFSDSFQNLLNQGIHGKLFMLATAIKQIYQNRFLLFN